MLEEIENVARVKFATGLGFLVIASTLLAMALTPKTIDGLPKSDGWVAFLLYVLGPAGFVILSLNISWIRQKWPFALLLVPLAYLAGVIVAMILAVNFGIIYP